MRIQTDGTITLEARECRVLREASAIVGHLAKNLGSQDDDFNGEILSNLATSLAKKPAPEPAKSKGAKKGTPDGT